jgi:hypothetical protein
VRASCSTSANEAWISVRSTLASSFVGSSDRFVVFRRARAVEGRDHRELRVRSSSPSSGAQTQPSPRGRPRQGGDHRLGLLLVGLALDPRLDRVAVLRRRQAHGDERVRLRQHVLVEHRRPLGDQHHAEAAHAAAAHDAVDVVQHPLRLRQRVLGAISSASSITRCSGARFSR